MGEKSGEEGFSDRFFLFAFVVLFMVTIIALPKYLKYRETASLPPEVQTLRRLHAAELKYRTRISLAGTFGDFKKLIDTELLPACPTCTETVYEANGQRFELNLNYEETRFCISVNSAKPQAIDTDGKLYENGSCKMGEAASSER